MKIAIIYPPVTYNNEYPLLTQNRQFKFTNSLEVRIYPVVMSYLATMLQKDSHEVLYLDGINSRLRLNEFNKKVGEEVNKAVGDQDARVRLRFLLTYLVEHNCSRYDMLIRSWAGLDPRVGEVLKKVDQFRLDTIYSILTDMGLSDNEAKMRSRIIVTYMSLRAGLFVKKSKKEELDAIDAQIAFFTRP